VSSQRLGIVSPHRTQRSVFAWLVLSLVAGTAATGPQVLTAEPTGSGDKGVQQPEFDALVDDVAAAIRAR
jgi:hypothetical protein